MWSWQMFYLICTSHPLLMVFRLKYPENKFTLALLVKVMDRFVCIWNKTHPEDNRAMLLLFSSPLLLRVGV